MNAKVKLLLLTSNMQHLVVRADSWLQVPPVKRIPEHIGGQLGEDELKREVGSEHLPSAFTALSCLAFDCILRLLFPFDR
jgi:hypothetical protein